VFTEISQRIDADETGGNAKRLDGALVVKRNGVYYLIIVELKFDKTYFKIV
jgi:beta-xylosidase